jgi:hypothetical protein
VIELDQPRNATGAHQRAIGRKSGKRNLLRDGPLDPDTTVEMFASLRAAWNVDLGDLRQSWAVPVLRSTIRLAVVLSLLTVISGALVLALLLLR